VDYHRLYEYLDAYRIVEIHFEKDDKYQTERELVSLDLLIVVLGLAELQNRMLGPIVCKVLTLRQHEGRPTWIYLPMLLGKVRDVYGEALSTLLANFPSVRPGVSVHAPRNVSHI